jgi:lipopolysaccharide export system permease protein
MIATGILARYFAGRFVRAIIIVFLTVAALALVLDVFELLRRAGDTKAVSTATLLWLAALRLPFVLEQIFAFGILFGAIAAFLGLSRKLELVIARSAGMSAWQFIMPALVVAVAFGIFAVTLFNPLVTTLKDRAEQLETSIFGGRGPGTARMGFWFRQRNADGEAVIRADRVEGADLANVTAFVYTPDGVFRERIEATKARLEAGRWAFSGIQRIPALGPATQPAEFSLETVISQADLDAMAERNPNASFWSLPGIIDRLELAGLSTTRYRLLQQSLLAKPFFFVAMVLVAASVSLRFFRIGGVAQMVAIGIVGGFALYILNRIGEDLGSAGVVSPIVAAWAAPVIGALVSVQALLRQEDG